MPYDSAKQRAFMEGCYHNRSSMKGHCPSKSAIRKKSGRGE